MSKARFGNILAIAATLALTAGCASKPTEPTLADAMRAHSDEQQRQSEIKKELAADWERGNELLRAGSKRIARGEQRIEEAELAIEKGTAEIESGTEQMAEGRALKAESERRFRERFPELSLDPYAAER
ncbi:MAG: hypothetical protein ACNS61_08420 [Candidatus Wenzhouxiangella sp. M2_3B_020]